MRVKREREERVSAESSEATSVHASSKANVVTKILRLNFTPDFVVCNTIVLYMCTSVTWIILLNFDGKWFKELKT